jgi:DnaJ-class molecular chaperone
MPEVPSTLVNCATCKGLGITATGKSTCPACDGLGKVKVAEPATGCPRCNGTGKATTGDVTFSSGRLCPVCGGIGWALILT